jgi:hypothetical protein
MAETLARTTVIKNFLNQGTARQVSNAEFMDFWKACSEEDRARFDVEARALALTPAAA